MVSAPFPLPLFLVDSTYTQSFSFEKFSAPLRSTANQITYYKSERKTVAKYYFSGEFWREKGIFRVIVRGSRVKKRRSGRQIVFAMWFMRVSAEAKAKNGYCDIFFLVVPQTKRRKKSYDCQRLRKLTLRCVHSAHYTHLWPLFYLPLLTSIRM